MGKLNPKTIAGRLGAEHRGRVSVTGGYFGALQLAAEVQRRFRTPTSGGRATDPTMTEQRLVRLKPETLARLEALAAEISESGPRVEPLQLAAILLERAAAESAEGGNA
jgi:hypothetical protein